MAYSLTKHMLAPIACLYIKNITGFENVPKAGPYILAANHASYMDHIILQACWLRKFNQDIHFLAKKEHFQGLQKYWHMYVKAIPIDRQSGGKDALQTAIKYLKNGKIIAIYPEGTRTLNGKMLQGKTGVARLALGAGVPVLPVGIVGTFNILPKGKIIPKAKRATIHIGKLMYFEDYYGKEDDGGIIRKVTDNIMNEIAKLAKQKYAY